MSIPGQKQNVRDPGMGLGPTAVVAALYMGTCEKGIVNQLYAFSNNSDVVDTLGQGALSEDLCYHLAIAGAPVYGMRLTGSIAGVAGSVSPTRVGTSTGTLTVAGAPFDAYEAQIQIMKTGGAGAGEFRYSLDDGYTFSEQIVIPSGGTYTIPNTNLTIAFVPGAGPTLFQAGDQHEFDCTAPSFSSTNLAAGIAALLAQPLELSQIALSGEFATSSAGAVIAAALAVHGASLFNQFRYLRFIQDSGTDTTTAATAAYAGVFADQRVAIAYGDCDVVSNKPFAGWGTPRRSITQPIAARVASILPSTDPARNADGPLKGVVAISHDEFRTELMDQRKFSTLRTWQGDNGFYITNVRFMSPTGSDYVFWQDGRLMDVACDTTAKAQRPFMNTLVRTKPDNTIAETEAARWEEPVLDALSANLLEPLNAEGTKGHVNAADYKVDRTVNLLQSNNVRGRVAIQRFPYAKTITTELSFAVSIGG